MAKTGKRGSRTPAQRKKDFLKALNENLGIVAHACKEAKVGRRTVYDWIKADKKFADSFDEVTEAQIDHVENKLLERINGVTMAKMGKNGKLTVYEVPPSDTAIIFYLKTRAKHRGYAEKVEVEHTGEQAITITRKVVQQDGKALKVA